VSIEAGRTMYNATRNPQPRPLDAATLRRSGVARGRAMHAARAGDRDVRDVLAGIADEAATPPQPAA